MVRTTKFLDLTIYKIKELVDVNYTFYQKFPVALQTVNSTYF